MNPGLGSTSTNPLIGLLADALSPTLPTAAPDKAVLTDSDLSEMRLPAGVPVVLPRPDFSSIRIIRKGADGKENVTPVDLAKAISHSDDQSPVEDIALQSGDTVELSLLPPSGGTAWQGLSPAEERFFRKALYGTITISSDDGVIRKVPLDYHQPDWRPTDFGLLPFRPASGMASTRLGWLEAHDGINYMLVHGDAMAPSNSGTFLRDGDELACMGVGPKPVIPPPSQPRQGYPPNVPPAPSNRPPRR